MKADEMLEVLGDGDVLKVDIGVHVKGRICDSAFTLAFDHTYDPLLEAVKAATDTGLRVSSEALAFLNKADCPPNFRRLELMFDSENLQGTFKRRWNLTRSWSKEKRFLVRTVTLL